MPDFKFDVPNALLPHDAKRADALANPYDEEVRDILWIDVPNATPNLVEAARRRNGTAKAYFGRGLTLRCTRYEARVFAQDPTDETVAELERSGHNFVVVRS